MKRIFCSAISGLVVGLFALSFPASAQSTGILSQIKAKYANFDKDIIDMKVTQTATITTPEGTVSSRSTLYTKNKKFRVETTVNMPKEAGMPDGMDTMTTIILYDGTDSWIISPFAGKQKIPPQEGNKYNSDRNWWDFISDNAKVAGDETVNGYNCSVLEVPEDAGTPFTKIWVDKQKLLFVKGEGKDADGRLLTWRHSDFRKIKGDWEMPYKTEMLADGAKLSDSLVETIDVNKNMSDKIFDAESVEVPGPNLQELMRNAPAAK